MKILSVAIPSYNSEAYMSKAIESCLAVREDIEIIIVNDGSKDNTGKIGDEYRQNFPDCIKCIHQENGGHGQAVNTGIKNASGLYFKVLDSDDWFDTDCLKKAVEQLKILHSENKDVDLFIANYVYDKPSENKAKSIKYTNALPQNRVFTWNEVGKFLMSQNLLMHSLIYKREVLIECGLELPAHTFYVDNLFAFIPLPSVKTMYYINLDLYRYFIGRSDQSVNEKIMIGRIDQQLRVNKAMIDNCDISSYEVKQLKDYMIKYLTMITCVSTVLLLRAGTDEHLDKKNQLWEYLKQKPELYKEVSGTMMGRLVQMNSSFGKAIIKKVYSLSQRIFGFN